MFVIYLYPQVIGIIVVAFLVQNSASNQPNGYTNKLVSIQHRSISIVNLLIDIVRTSLFFGINTNSVLMVCVQPLYFVSVNIFMNSEFYQVVSDYHVRRSRNNDF